MLLNNALNLFLLGFLRPSEDDMWYRFQTFNYPSTVVITTQRERELGIIPSKTV